MQRLLTEGNESYLNSKTLSYWDRPKVSVFCVIYNEAMAVSSLRGGGPMGRREEIGIAGEFDEHLRPAISNNCANLSNDTKLFN
jgi:hypothetical protein